MVAQGLQLAKKPHIIIATPGRLVDHLENMKGFNLKAIKYLVMDEADRILNMDFEVELDKILKVLPRERRTFLFSATMTKKVKKLQRASLKDPVKVEVSNKYQTVEQLQQYYLFIPVKYKDVPCAHTQRTGRQQLHDILQHLQQHCEDGADASGAGIGCHSPPWSNVAEQAAGGSQQVQGQGSFYSHIHRCGVPWPGHPARGRGPEL